MKKWLNKIWLNLPVMMLRKTRMMDAHLVGVYHNKASEQVDEIVHLKNRVEQMREDRKLDKSNTETLAEQVCRLMMGYGRGSVVTHTTSNVPVVARSFSVSPLSGDILVKAEWLHADLNGIEKRWVTYPANEMILLGEIDELAEVDADED